MLCRIALLFCLWWLVPAESGLKALEAKKKLPDSKKARAGAGVSYEKDVLPLLSDYCYACHGNGKQKGDVALDIHKDPVELLKDQKTWERVLANLRNHTMPPENKKQPSEAERRLVIKWIETEIFKFDCEQPDPGRVTVRRLNRAEYNNTIRDLVGVDFKPAEDFPADDSGYGFDNIGDALSLPPVLLERYLTAAHKVLDAAIVSDSSNKPAKKTFQADSLDGSAPGGAVSGGIRELGREGDIFVPFKFPVDGDYILRAKAWGQQAGPEPARMTFRLDGKDLKTFDVTVEESDPQLYEIKVSVAAGERKFAAAYINNYRNPEDPDPRNRDRNLFIEYLEIVGPFNAAPATLPETHRRIFTHTPEKGKEMRAARAIIGNFAKRAYRRPLATNELERLVNLAREAFRNSEPFGISVSVALQATLVSPHFLFRGEVQPEPDDPQSVHMINEFALASRLSYFLWSSMPDAELFALAEKRKLRQNLDAQVKRMINDPKRRALVDNFAGQWLQLRNLKLVTPDPWVYPEFDDELRAAMEQETKLLFETILHEDRCILEFLDANYTFLNERLARHYGIDGVRGQKWQRVTLKDRRRGGILTQGSVLTIASNPTRTSPVKRGKWVLENILGAPPPPPPPDVPELDEGKDKVLTGTLRQRTEQHRANALCASCHQRMDPIGFGFENYNGIGGWRTQDGALPVEPAGTLASGESFQGPEDLKTVLATEKRDDFARCLTEKMLTYALGRGTEYYDKCAIDEIAERLKKDEYRFSSLILGVVKSVPFQMRRGEGKRLAEKAK